MSEGINGEDVLYDESKPHCEGGRICLLTRPHLFVCFFLSFVLLRQRPHPFSPLIELVVGIKFGLGEKHSRPRRSLGAEEPSV